MHFLSGSIYLIVSILKNCGIGFDHVAATLNTPYRIFIDISSSGAPLLSSPIIAMGRFHRGTTCGKLVSLDREQTSETRKVYRKRVLGVLLLNRLQRFHLCSFKTEEIKSLISPNRRDIRNKLANNFREIPRFLHCKY